MSTEQTFEIADDLQVNPDNYPQVETGPRPPLPGNYMVKVTKWDFKRDRNTGEMVLWKKDGKPTYPVIVIQTVEITDPQDNARKVSGLFQDVPTFPFDRDGKQASQAGDLLVSIDAQATTSNSGELVAALTQHLNAGAEFRARIDYLGYDGATAKKNVAALGSGATQKQINEAYSKAKIRGYRQVQKANAAAQKANLPLYKWAAPSGEVVELRPALTTFFPASEADSVLLGPDRAAVEAITKR